MKQRSSHHIFGIAFAIIFLLCGVTSFTGCANDATVLTPKIADSLDIMTGCQDVGGIGLSPDGTRLAIYSGRPTSFGKLTVYETSTGKIVSEFENPKTFYFTGFQFSVDNSKILMADYGTVSVLYDISQPKAIVLTTLYELGEAQLFDDGNTILASGYGSYTTPLALYSAIDGKEIKHLRSFYYDTYSRALGYIREKNSIVYLNTKRSTHCSVVDIATNMITDSIPMESTPGDFHFSEDGRIIAYQTRAGLAFVNTVSGKIISTLEYSVFLMDAYVGAFAVTKDYFCGVKNIDSIASMEVLSINDLKTVVSKLLPNDNPYIAIAASRQQNCVAVLLTNGLVRLWRIDL